VNFRDGNRHSGFTGLYGELLSSLMDSMGESMKVAEQKLESSAMKPGITGRVAIKVVVLVRPSRR